MAWRVGLVLALAAALLQAYLVKRTQEELGRLAARLVPHGELRYERLWPLPWGAGRIWGLSFQPEGLLQLSLQTPPGLRVHARELQVHRVRLDAGGLIERVEGRLISVEIPVAPLPAAETRGSDLARQHWPSLHELGFERIALDVDFRVQYLAQADLAVIELDATGAGLGRARANLQLEGSPHQFQRIQDQIRLRSLDLSFVDEGLLGRYKATAAVRARLAPADWERATILALDRRMRTERWRWDGDSVNALFALIREPRSLRLRIDPRCDVLLRDVRRYPYSAWADRLGFVLRIPSEAETGTQEPTR